MSSQKKELERINDHIEELFNKWKALQHLQPEDQERFDKKVRLEWNYHSNHIEGNTLTYNETKALLDEGKEEGIHPPRDYKEIKAHDLAINKIREFAKDKERKLNEVTIRDLNQIILKEPFWKDAVTSDGQKTKKKIFPGQYKTQPNHVITEEGKIFKFTEPHDVPIKMQELMDWFHKEMENSSLSIASFVAQLHHRFIVIHPFDDGNGRIVRLWINYVLLRFGYPPLVIKSEDKRNYFAALQRADNDDIDSLAVYLGKGLIFWLETGIKAGKGEDISEMGDVDKEVDLFIREQEGKGLNKYFSKESVINLIDNLSEMLFEIFKNKFKRFDELFDSLEMYQITKAEGIDVARNKLVEHPKKFTDNIDIKNSLGLLDAQAVSFENIGVVQIYITLSYRSYKGQLSKNLKEPFDMETILLVKMNKFKYTISIEAKNYIGKKVLPEGRVDIPGIGISNYNYKEPEEENRGKDKTISKERYYNQLLTQEEANKFVAEGKKEFLKLLKSALGKDIEDKK